jgi:hypothetical protein
MSSENGGRSGKRTGHAEAATSREFVAPGDRTSIARSRTRGGNAKSDWRLGGCYAPEMTGCESVTSVVRDARPVATIENRRTWVATPSGQKPGRGYSRTETRSRLVSIFKSMHRGGSPSCFCPHYKLRPSFRPAVSMFLHGSPQPQELMTLSRSETGDRSTHCALFIR